DDRAVLVPEIRALAIQRRRVVHVPKGVEQFRIGHLGGVVCDLHRLGVAGPARAHLLVGHVVNVAALVARNRLDDTWHLVDQVLAAPEASARKGCFFHVRAPAYRRGSRQIGDLATSYRRTRGGNGTAGRHPGGHLGGHGPDGDFFCLPRRLRRAWRPQGG